MKQYSPLTDFFTPSSTRVDGFRGKVIPGRSRFAYVGLPKRVFDIFLAILIAPIILPVIACLWAIVRSEGGSGFYGHTRIGRNGVPFKCYKIRSMCVNSQQALADHLAANPEAAAEWARDFKLENDPRITKIGKFIRRTSLDELPQLFNVFKGEMSFVGPRPVTQVELDQQYGDHAKTYYKLMPGITGPWQVSGRNDVSYEERVQMDVDYYASASLATDISIIARTGGAVLKMTGK